MGWPGGKGKQKAGAEEFGGAEDNTSMDPKYQNTESFNKGGHKERSLENAPEHKGFWKKAGENLER
jgi:hypothetical protein